MMNFPQGGIAQALAQMPQGQQNPLAYLARAQQPQPQPKPTGIAYQPGFMDAMRGGDVGQFLNFYRQQAPQAQPMRDPRQPMMDFKASLAGMMR